jgi:hypothetical protein
MPLYYAPAVTSANGTINPGKVVDGLPVDAFDDAYPPHTRSIRYDSDAGRFVIWLHPAFDAPLPGWEKTTEADVLRAYPGTRGEFAKIRRDVRTMRHHFPGIRRR